MRAKSPTVGCFARMMTIDASHEEKHRKKPVLILVLRRIAHGHIQRAALGEGCERQVSAIERLSVELVFLHIDILLAVVAHVDDKLVTLIIILVQTNGNLVEQRTT